MITFSIAITLVIERLKMAQELRQALLDQNLHAEITFYTDTARSGVWWNTERAWKGYNPRKTHHLILQEDTLPCPNFFKHLQECVEQKPDEIIHIYNGEPAWVKRAQKADSAWYVIKQGAAGPGILMPTRYIPGFLSWVDRHISRKIRRNSDNRVVAWAGATNRRIWNTMPELIEHIGGECSTLAAPSATKHGYFLAGAEPIDWSRGSDGSCCDNHDVESFTKWYAKWYLK